MAAQEVSFDAPRPYKIAIPDEELDRVRRFAHLTNFDAHRSKALDKDTGQEYFQYGLTPSKLVELVERVKSGYDWRKEEKAMNELGEHSIVKLHGVPDQGDLDMHVVHRQSNDPHAVPLLLAHGWPGSFFEFRYLAPLLTEGSPAFHVVMPSLPGFTFSGPMKRTPADSPCPLTNKKLGICCDAVMRALGYNEYVAQGGDVGSVVARMCAQLFPQRCRSIHLNFLHASEQLHDQMSAAEKRGHQRRADFVKYGQGYSALQGVHDTLCVLTLSRLVKETAKLAQTLGGVLASSPIATIAYLAEKWYRWSSPDKQPTLDEVITNSLLYYLSGSLASSFWFYYNLIHDADASSTSTAVTKDIPIGISLGRYEIAWVSEAKAKDLCPELKSYHLLDRGSHFLAHEAPELLADEMRAHFSQFGLRSTPSSS